MISKGFCIPSSSVLRCSRRNSQRKLEAKIDPEIGAELTVDGTAGFDGSVDCFVPFYPIENLNHLKQMTICFFII